jgi:taurine dioxygenase
MSIIDILTYPMDFPVAAVPLAAGDESQPNNGSSHDLPVAIPAIEGGAMPFPLSAASIASAPAAPQGLARHPSRREQLQLSKGLNVMPESRRRPSPPFVAASPGESYHALSVKPLTPAIGAEIGGLDLSRPLSDEVIGEVRRALLEHLVIFFRDQQLTGEQHMAFGRKFGDLHIHPAAPSEPEHPALMIIAADENSSRANGEAWHTDVSCDVEPPMGSILYIREVPPLGGDTLFANMYAAYDALSERMKAHLDGLLALHDGEHVYRGLYSDVGVADRPSYPRARHPVVRTHPETGRKGLYVNSGFTTRILDLPTDESDALLRYLFRHIEHPAFQCRFRWTAGAIAFWDNRCAQHHAVWDYWPGRRYGNRVTVKGDKPF